MKQTTSSAVTTCRWSPRWRTWSIYGSTSKPDEIRQHPAGVAKSFVIPQGTRMAGLGPPRSRVAWVPASGRERIQHTGEKEWGFEILMEVRNLGKSIMTSICFKSSAEELSIAVVKMQRRGCSVIVSGSSSCWGLLCPSGSSRRTP